MACRLTSRHARAAAHPLALAAGSCIAYYAGATVGLAFRFPPATSSVMWPPNAVLTAFLLFTPVRSWWIVLLAALPAHVALELRAWSLPLVLSLFLTNCSEALLAAWGVRLLSSGRFRLDTLRRMSIFIAVAVIVAPFVTTFPDAAVVARFHGEDYWAAWNNRFPSNVLAQITVVPVVAGAIGVARGSLWRWSRRDWFEALLLSIGLLVSAALVTSPGTSLWHDARLPMVLFLPFLLWAALRFGPEGAALSLLATTILTLAAATRGKGPFDAAQSADAGVRTLQLFLIIAAIPVMCVGALDHERRWAESALSERLRFEELLSRMSRAFVRLPGHEMDEVFPEWLGQLASFFGLGPVYVALYDESSGRMPMASSGGPLDGQLSALQLAAEFPDAVERVRTDRVVILDAGAAAGRTSDTDGDALARYGLERVVLVSMTTGDEHLGVLALMTKRQGILREGLVLGRLSLAADVFTNALARRRADGDAQRAREELAHLTRVSAMGELAASLAHELNQPLTGILMNARVAGRLIAGLPQMPPALLEILQDIVDDDKRAGEVISRMRELLGKRSSEAAPVDVNEVVNGVTKLVTSDSIIRQVSIGLDLAPDDLIVEGDRVQLQQVVLSLLLNALEATSTLEHGPRRVVITTDRRDAHSIHVVVRDNGPGLPPGMERQVFEPFYTTKGSGLGMGLSIARSIVEWHGGSIWATGAPEHGAEFHFTLPQLVQAPWLA